MALRGKLEVDIELKSNADKYWQTIRDSTTIFPKAFPHDYKSIDVLEGDGKAPGSVRHFHYAEGKTYDNDYIYFHYAQGMIIFIHASDFISCHFWWFML